MTTLDPAFLCLSPASADPATISVRLRIEEVARELEQRRKGYPARMERGLLSTTDAERGLNAFAAILADLRAEEATNTWHAASAGTAQEADAWAALQLAKANAAPLLAAFTWSQLVSALRREIAIRRKYYPQWVKAGTMNDSDARHRIERIEAVHFDWWRWGRHFMPDEISPAGIASPGAARAAFQSAHRAHRARFDDTSPRGEYAQGTPASLPTPEPELLFG